jgi:hypothetical protein
MRLRQSALDGGATPVAGALPWLALPGGEALLVESGRFAVARPRSASKMLAARASDSVLWRGDLAPMLRRVVGASAVFVALHARAAERDELDRAVAGLGRLETAGLAVEVADAVTLTLHLAFADITTATRVLAELERQRGALGSSPWAALLGRIQATIDGPLLALSLRLDEGELARLARETEIRPGE